MTQPVRLYPLIVSLGIALLSNSNAFAGPFGDPGYDPAAMFAWATGVEEFLPGPIDIAMPELGTANFGVPGNALGAPMADGFAVYSLGDGGEITLYFESGIGDGIGDDFAVYENGFFTPGGLFAEFAFVDVSSNGLDFARFDATTLHATPVSSFDPIDPSDYDNLAGDQPLDLGTGFNLAELASHPFVTSGLLNLSDIRFVRLVDVIGDGSELDGTGQPIYDPYPTAFASGGFDVDAVGVLHTAPEPNSFAMLAAGIVFLSTLSRHRHQDRQCVQCN